MTIRWSNTPRAIAAVFITADRRERRFTPKTGFLLFELSRVIYPHAEKVSAGQRAESIHTMDLTIPSRKMSVLVFLILIAGNISPSLVYTVISYHFESSISEILKIENPEILAARSSVYVDRRPPFLSPDFKTSWLRIHRTKSVLYGRFPITPSLFFSPFIVASPYGHGARNRCPHLPCA